MKILHISNFVQKHDGRLYWNHCFKINNGFIRNGHNVLSFSDRDISRQNILNRFNNNKTLNRKLINTFINFEPDIVVLGHADRVFNSTLAEFRSKKNDIKIIEWSVDNYYLDNTENKFTSRSDYIDAFFITNADEQLSSCLSKNNSISFFPNIFDLSIENKRIFEFVDFQYDVFFALSFGVGTGKIRASKSDYDRENYLKYLNVNYPNIKTNFFGYEGKQPIWGAEFERELCKSPISLNLSRKPHIKYYSSDRISQYLGNGSCIFVDINSKLNDLFTDDEVVFYYSSNDYSDFANKVEYFTKNIDKAKKIAKKGWEKGHRDFNGKVITNYFIDTVINEKPLNTYNWPIHQYFK